MLGPKSYRTEPPVCTFNEARPLAFRGDTATRVPKSSIEQHLVMWYRRPPHLECNSRKPAEDLVDVQHFPRNSFSITDQQSACWSSQSVKLSPRCRGPASFLADLRERVSIRWVEIFRSFLCCVAQESNRVQSHNQLLVRVSGRRPASRYKSIRGRNRFGSAPIIATIKGSPSVCAPDACSSPCVYNQRTSWGSRKYSAVHFDIDYLLVWADFCLPCNEDR